MSRLPALLLILTVLAGCGKGAYVAPAETRLAAQANALCKQEKREAALIRSSEREPVLQATTKLRALFHAHEKLPGLRTLLSDRRARGKVEASLQRLNDRARLLRQEEYRLVLKIQADLRALGMTACIGPRPQNPATEPFEESE